MVGFLFVSNVDGITVWTLKRLSPSAKVAKTVAVFYRRPHWWEIAALGVSRLGSRDGYPLEGFWPDKYGLYLRGWETPAVIHPEVGGWLASFEEATQAAIKTRRWVGLAHYLVMLGVDDPELGEPREAECVLCRDMRITGAVTAPAVCGLCWLSSADNQRKLNRRVWDILQGEPRVNLRRVVRADLRRPLEDRDEKIVTQNYGRALLDFFLTHKPGGWSV